MSQITKLSKLNKQSKTNKLTKKSKPTKKNKPTKKSKPTKQTNILKLNTINNNFINNKFKDVFSNNKKISKDIVFLKKISFDIFYSYKHKYPLLVREQLNNLTGKGKEKIIRDQMIDNWKNDKAIPLKKSYNLNDYQIYIYYGGSLGHMAPASWHKLNINDYHETFLFSNIVPQNYIMNSGIWNFLEIWCYNLNYNKKLFNINIFTGCISNNKNTILYNANLDKSQINIPTDMYKIIVFNHVDFPYITFIDIIIIKNKSIDIIKNINNNTLNFYKYILSKNLYKSFETNTGLNIKNLLLFYNINNTNLQSFKKILNLNYNPNKLRSKEINNKFIFWYNLLNTKTLDELYTFITNNNIIDINFILNNLNFDNYIIIYVYSKRNLLIREQILFTDYKSLEEFNLFFHKFKDELYNKYVINQNIEIDLFKIKQDEYLIKYYNIVKKKLTKN